MERAAALQYQKRSSSADKRIKRAFLKERLFFVVSLMHFVLNLPKNQPNLTKHCTKVTSCVIINMRYMNI